MIPIETTNKNLSRPDPDRTSTQNMGNRDSSTEDDDVESGRVPTSVELMSSSNATDSSHVEIVTPNQQPGLSVITLLFLFCPLPVNFV